MGLVLSDAPVGLVLLSVGCGLALKDVRQGLRGVRLARHLNDFFFFFRLVFSKNFLLEVAIHNGIGIDL